MPRIFTMTLSGAALALTLFSAPAISQAAEPGKDHPLVGRYEGSQLVFSEIKAYDEANLIQGPTRWPQDEKNIKANTARVEGAIMNLQYKLPEGRSLLEVQRNYENSLKSRGFQMLFTCRIESGKSVKESSCFQIDPDKEVDIPLWRFMNIMASTRWPAKGVDPYAGYNDNPFGSTVGGTVRNYFGTSGRYLLAKRDSADGATYASIALSEGSFAREDGRDLNANYAFVRAVDVKAMDADKITFVDASAMQKSLDATGRVNLYGIYFDTDKDTIKPESRPTLDEISKLMNANPQLHLQVVGHTDSTGGDAHNQDLSNRRASSVIRALAQAGIDAKRFASRGAGASEPVESNDSEQGRAKNRRVELVRM